MFYKIFVNYQCQDYHTADAITNVESLELVLKFARLYTRFWYLDQVDDIEWYDLENQDNLLEACKLEDHVANDFACNECDPYAFDVKCNHTKKRRGNLQTDLFIGETLYRNSDDYVNRYLYDYLSNSLVKLKSEDIENNCPWENWLFIKDNKYIFKHS